MIKTKTEIEIVIKTVIAIENRMEIVTGIVIGFVVVIVIAGNHLMDNVVIPIQMTPSSYHQAFSDERAF